MGDRGTRDAPAHLPAEGADSSAAVDHVEQRVDRAVTERHYLAERQRIVELDTIVGVDPDSE